MSNPTTIRKMSKQEIVAANHRFNSGSRLNSLLPFVAPGNVHITQINCICTACGETIDSGFVSVTSRWIGGTLIIDCAGICQPCNCLTTHYFRFHKEAHITTLIDNQWQTIYLPSASPPWWDIVSKLQRCLRKKHIY